MISAQSKAHKERRKADKARAASDAGEPAGGSADEGLPSAAPVPGEPGVATAGCWMAWAVTGIGAHARATKFVRSQLHVSQQFQLHMDHLVQASTCG